VVLGSDSCRADFKKDTRNMFSFGRSGTALDWKNVHHADGIACKKK
jgi:hypothetical protein